MDGAQYYVTTISREALTERQAFQWPPNVRVYGIQHFSTSSSYLLLSNMEGVCGQINVRTVLKMGKAEHK